jgi:hypothetical protein
MTPQHRNNRGTGPGLAEIPGRGVRVTAVVHLLISGLRPPLAEITGTRYRVPRIPYVRPLGHASGILGQEWKGNIWQQLPGKTESERRAERDQRDVSFRIIADVLKCHNRAEGVAKNDLSVVRSCRRDPVVNLSLHLGVAQIEFDLAENP